MKKLPKSYDERMKFTKTQKVLIFICGFLLTFGIITRLMGGNIASKAGYDAFSMLRYSLIDNPARTVTAFFDDFSSMWSVRQENDDLKAELAAQKLYKAELDDVKRQLKELEELSAINSGNDYESIMASVLNRDIQAWSNTLTINKGSNEGIQTDMAVITNKGLLGKVIEVNKNTAKVQLLTAEKTDSSVAVKIEIDKDNAIDGFLEKYDRETGAYEISIFDSNVKIKAGMKVVTSGKGGVFPSGILVGEVIEVSDLYNAEGKSIMVKPAVNFNSFDYVSVLKVK